MPYRIDLADADSHAIDLLIDLGALDADVLPGGAVAALMPDAVSADRVARALGVERVEVSAAVGRDAGSVWVLHPRAIRVGRLQIAPAGSSPGPDTVQLIDTAAFGTGLHPTTALCLEALQDLLQPPLPRQVLDVGTGSGVLALAALTLGVPSAVGLDIEDVALLAATENGRVNGLGERLRLVRGGPDAVSGSWSVVLANVLAAPLMEMAPSLARLLGHAGQIVLSGIPTAVEGDVTRAYVRAGLQPRRTLSREGWVALVMGTSW